MSEYKELIKNFARIRDYMRDFFVFGFKTRCDYDKKSLRTYDNERRRIENYLSNFIRQEYSEKGKNIFISVDSSQILENPFYKAYKSKSFTRKDVILHFYIIDILTSNNNLTLEEISNLINDKVEDYIEPQTVRNKLKEYIEYGIINVVKEKKTYLYSLNKCFIEDFNLSNDTLAFFSEISPFGVIGSYLNDRINNKNTKFHFKHNFIVNTLEDNILLDLTNAIKEQKRVLIENFSDRQKDLKIFDVLPLKIFVSVQTGRRYLVTENTGKHKFSVYRLDYIKKVTLLNKDSNYQKMKEIAENCMKNSFSTTMHIDIKPEYFEMILKINEEKEKYIISRLKREGRNGKLEKIAPNTFKFSIAVYDTNELTTWIKTFIGRIIEINGDNKSIIGHFYADFKKMKKLYRRENE